MITPTFRAAILRRRVELACKRARKTFQQAADEIGIGQTTLRRMGRNGRVTQPDILEAIEGWLSRHPEPKRRATGASSAAFRSPSPEPEE